MTTVLVERGVVAVVRKRRAHGRPRGRGRRSIRTRFRTR